MIDWNKFSNAVEANILYRDSFGKTVAQRVVKRPTQKTIANAVEQPHFKATRENLEKIAKDAQGVFVEVEQEGEKWTHRAHDGDRCKVIYEGEKRTWVLTEYNQDKLVKNEDLKPIKPTISEAEAWRMAVLAGNMSHITDSYDVVKD